MTGAGYLAAAPDTAKWLRLAAAPVFAIMALPTGLSGSPMPGLCGSGHAASIHGMAAMYLLMSMFHLPPWLTLIHRPAAGTKIA